MGHQRPAATVGASIAIAVVGAISVVAAIGVVVASGAVAGAFASDAQAPAQAPARTPAQAPQQGPAAKPGEFAPAARAAAQLPRLHSLLVSRRGEIVLEYYARAIRPTRPANIKSASKSVISALAGIAIDRGLIKSVREPIVTFFPELRRDSDPRRQTITIEDLLTMRAGLESTSGEHYGRWVGSRNWVSYALGRPLIADPGTGMQYSTGRGMPG